MTPSRIDLADALGSRATISVDPVESAEEHTARIRTEREKARYEIVRAYALLLVALLLFSVVIAICTYKIFDPTAPAETARWAQTVLASLLTGLVSYIVGQKTAKSS